MERTRLNDMLTLEEYVKKVLHTCKMTKTELDIDYFSERTAEVFLVNKEDVLKIIGTYNFT